MDFQLTASEIASYNRRRPKKARSSLCHAPSRSLYFGMRGEVMVCCANRSHLAGRYPEQSIRECWTSAQTQKVRKALETGDMTQGCQKCYDIIRSGNYQNMPGRLYDVIPPHPEGWPRRMDFELTNTCNLECVMCRGELSSAIRRNRDKLPPIPSPYGDDFLKELEEFIPHLSESYFAGGEPFMIRQYEEIWDRMTVLNPDHHLSIQTNATLISNRIKQLLEKLRVSIAVSIDSVDPERLESIRVNAKWETVLPNINYFADYCRRKKTQLTISYTPMRLNWMELPEAIQFCNQRGIKIYFNSLTYPRHLAFDNMAAGELQEISDFVNQYKPPKGNEVKRANRSSYLDLVNQIDYWKQEAEKREKEATPKESLRGEAWYAALKAHTQNNFPPEKAHALYTEMRQKLMAVFEEVSAQGQEEALWTHVSKVDFTMLCTYIPGKTEQELIAALRTSVMPAGQPRS